MATVTVRRVIGAAAKLAESSETDAELLRRFAADEDQQAFAAIVRRHTNLVLGVCRRSLVSATDAEDACQAVFVVLAKKAKSGRWQPSIVNWLYTTARRVSKDARVAAERRAKHEGKAGRPDESSPIDQMTGRELLAVIDDELDRLSGIYREPLVLCFLEGMSREDVATRLGLPAGTVKTRLERGRKKLADALTKRGVALGAGLLTLATTSPVVASAGASPPRLLDSILASATGQPSAAVAALVRGVAVGTWKSKAALAVAVLFGVAVTATLLTRDVGAGDKPAEKDKPAAKAEPGKEEAKGVTITGKVVDPDGKPVAEAVLRMPEMVDIKKLLLAKTPTKPPVVEVARTDADGKFTVLVPPLPAGTPDYRQLVATKPGFGPAWIDVREANDTPVSLQLVADDVPVKGRVTDLEGKPVAKAKVELKYVAAGDLAKVWEGWSRRPESALQPLRNLWAELSGLPTSVLTDADGKFELTGVGRGRVLAFSVEGPGIETAGCRVVTDAKFDPKKVEQPSHETMPGGLYMPGPALYGPTFTHAGKPSQPVVGVVTDGKTGKPIAGVQVNGQVDGPHWYENGGRAFTDADGKFTMHGIAKAERVRLMVFPSAKLPYFQYSTTVASKPGLTEIPAELKLTKGVMVKGRVVEKDGGKPVAGAGIRYTALADNKYHAELMAGKRGEHGMAWNSDADGRFEMIVLPGSGIVTAQGETRARQRGTDFTQVRMAKGDLPRALGRDQESLGESFTAADGHYVTLFSLSGYKIIDPKPTDDTVEVEIVFDRGNTATGKVVDADGKPALSAMAYKLTACYDMPQKLKDGTFTAIALEQDHPRVVVFADIARKQAAVVTLKGDEKDVTVKMQPFGKLTGRLLDAEGKPVAGATVKPYLKQHMTYMGVSAALHDASATTDAEGKFVLEVPGCEAEYRPGFMLKNKFLNTTVGYDSPGHAVKPGGSTDIGEVRVKAE